MVMHYQFILLHSLSHIVVLNPLCYFLLIKINEEIIHMQARDNAHEDEIALIGTMSRGNQIEAARKIHNFLSYQGDDFKPSLLYIDDNNINFLTFAFHLSLRHVAKTLIETNAFDESQAILLGKNTKEQTLICQASQLSYHESVELLFHRIMHLISTLSDEEKVTYHQFWFTPDREGNTPLHYAAKNRNSHLYLFILQLIEKEPNKNELLNAKNNNGDTAFHLAISDRGMLHPHLINSLLTAGADIHLLNQYRQSSFDKILAHTKEEQIVLIRVLSQLSEENKAYLLKLYEHYLKINPHATGVRQVYVSYKGVAESLKEMIIANLEYSNVEARDWYTKTIRRADQYKLKLMYETIPISFEGCMLYLYLQNESIKFALQDSIDQICHEDLTSPDLDSIKEVLRQPGAVLSDEQWQNLKIILEEKFKIKLLPDHTLFTTYPERCSVHEVKLETYRVNDTIHKVRPLNFAERLPLYVARLSQGIFGSDRRVIQKLLQERKSIEANQQCFDDLIQQMEQRMKEWSDRQASTWPYKALAIAMPVIAWMGLAVGIGYAIYRGIKFSIPRYWADGYESGYGWRHHENVFAYNHTAFINTSHYDCDLLSDENNSWVYLHEGNNLTFLGGPDWFCGFSPDEQGKTDVGGGTFVGGSIAGIINGILTDKSYKQLWHYTPPVKIYDTEWDDLVLLLQNNIILPYHSLPDGKLPTDGKKIADLTHEISSLGPCQKQDDLIAIWNRIVTHVRQIKNDQLYSGMSFELPDVVSDHSDSLGSNDSNITEQSRLLMK